MKKILRVAALATALTLLGLTLASATSFLLTFSWTESDTTNRTLTWLVNGANRTISLTGNPTLADWFDQSVKTTASPTFAGILSLATVSNHATSPVTVSSVEVKGNVVTNLGAGGSITYTLPAATVGMVVAFYVEAAQPMVLTPATGDQFMVLTTSANKTLTGDSVVGSYIGFICLQAGKWYPAGYDGTWTSS